MLYIFFWNWPCFLFVHQRHRHFHLIEIPSGSYLFTHIDFTFDDLMPENCLWTNIAKIEYCLHYLHCLHFLRWPIRKFPFTHSIFIPSTLSPPHSLSFIGDLFPVCLLLGHLENCFSFLNLEIVTEFDLARNLLGYHCLNYVIYINYTLLLQLSFLSPIFLSIISKCRQCFVLIAPLLWPSAFITQALQ